MIVSMTGFGRGEWRDASGAITVEMRSVNNRYLDLQVKTPRSISMLESRIRKMVQERFYRGRIDVFINRSGGEAVSCNLVVDHELAGRYVVALRELKDRFGLPGDVDVAMVSAIPEIIVREERTEDPEELWRHVAKGLDQAMAGLRVMRETEGAALARDIASRIDGIESLVVRIRERAPLVVTSVRQRLVESLERLMKESPDPARVAQEIALFADRTDVTEELTRLGSHIAQFRAMLSGSGNQPVGRKLEFLLQEIGREVNTVGSKSLDAEISTLVVTAKAELEKIREQVQNIE